MSRFALIVWLCFGAFGFGLVLLEATRRKRPLRPGWFMLALVLGPIFFFFVLPLWLGRWGKEPPQVNKEQDPE